MHSPHSHHPGDFLDLTLPERVDVQSRPFLMTASSVAISSKLTVPAALLEEWRTGLRVCLPWRPARMDGRSKDCLVPQAIVVIISAFVLVSCLRMGASLGFLCWWAAATLALLCTLAWERPEPVVEIEQQAKETATMVFVVAQFVSVAVIWTMFYTVRLR